MLALDETLPPHESIGVNEVAVFLTIEGKLQGFVNSRNAVQIGSRRRVAQHCMSDVRVPAFIPSGANFLSESSQPHSCRSVARPAQFRWLTASNGISPNSHCSD
jgi:hypothetical protein